VSLTPGDRFGHYRIVGKLGEGGMGEVYRAHDETLGREVAVKVVSARFAGDPERLARMDREAQVLAALNHPNIATIHGRRMDAPSPAATNPRASSGSRRVDSGISFGRTSA
jgi:serine/threonine protein kinase